MEAAPCSADRACLPRQPREHPPLMSTVIVLAFCCATVPAVLWVWNMVLYREPWIWQLCGNRQLALCRTPSRCSSPRAMKNASSAPRLRACLPPAESRSRSLCWMTARPIEQRRSYAALPSRMRACVCESSPPLPNGWNGKQHACHALAAAARFEYPLFSRRGCASRSRSSGSHVVVFAPLRLRSGERLSPPGDGDFSGVAYCCR